MHPYRYSLTNDILLGNKAPATAIVTVTAIVTHHKVTAFGNLPLPFRPGPNHFLVGSAINTDDPLHGSIGGIQ